MLLAFGVVGMLLLGAACSSGDADKGAKKDSAPAAVVAVDANGAVTVVAKDNSYAPKDFTAKAGQKTSVTLDNQGAAIHNIALKGQKGADGNDMQTALIPAKQKATLEFTLPAGVYDLYCTVHPLDMTGKLTVS